MSIGDLKSILKITRNAARSNPRASTAMTISGIVGPLTTLTRYRENDNMYTAMDTVRNVVIQLSMSINILHH